MEESFISASDSQEIVDGLVPPEKPQTQSTPQLHIATVATHIDRYMPLLVQSSARFHVKLDILGWGEKLTGGLAFKLKKALAFVETLPPHDVIMFIDAFDVVLLQQADVIMTKFNASGAEMIISKDGDHPNLLARYCMRQVFPPVAGNTYINTGAYIGRAGFCTQFLTEVAKFGQGFSIQENDQELVTRYLIANPHLLGKQILVDHNSDLFLTVYGGDRFWIGSSKYKLSEHRADLEITEDTPPALHYLKTDSWPCVVHAPSSTDMSEVWDALGYKLPPEVDKERSALAHTKYMLKMTAHYWPFLQMAVVKLLLLVLAVVLIGYMLYRMVRKPVVSPSSASVAAGPVAPPGVRWVPYQEVPTTAAAVPTFPRAFLFQPVTS